MKRVPLTIAVLVIICAAASAVASDSTTSASAVRITIDVARNSSSTTAAKQTYELIAPIDGHASISLGNRVPIPIQTSPNDDSAPGQTGSITKYSYQNVGFTAKIQTTVEDDGRIRVAGNIEISSVRTEPAHAQQGVPPVVEAVDQRFQMLTNDGVSMRLLNVKDPATSDLTIDLTATLVR